MNISFEELQKEKENLEKTLEVIKALVDENDADIKETVSGINELKRYIWENQGVLDEVEVSQGHYDVNTSVNNTNERIKNLERLKRSLISPYFGRVDFDSEGYLESIYIGINGIMKDMESYVYDWRSPIASLFYNYGVGAASYTAPLGDIVGQITLKRQFKINGNEIERCFNSDINIDDEYLQEILNNSSSDKMVNIVNTIQKEQNEIIRNITDKYLIVQGIAGSGKTSVALHRIAYLLYKEKNLKSNNILIFSPNDIFSEYISNVLPELGEDNVLQSTFSNFANAYITEFKAIESFTSFVERFYKNNNLNATVLNTIGFKVSDNFKAYLDDFIAEYKSSIVFKNDINIAGHVIAKDELNELLKERYNRLPLFSRIITISEHLCDIYNISYKKNGNKIIEGLMNNLSENTNVYEIYKEIVESDTFKTRAELNENAKFECGKPLNYEDLLPIMYLRFELYGYPKANNIKHIIIDEAQDYSLLQLHMLKAIFNTASFTILGDIHQTINPFYKYHNLDDMNVIFENKARYIELSKTYRSTEEIINFTNQILDLDNVCSVRKTNQIPVELRNIEDRDLLKQLINDINDMRQNGIKRIAIISKNNNEAQTVYDLLKASFEDLCLLNETNKKAIGNLVVLPSYISKGLEFDGVIAYTKPNNQYNEKDKYLFYVVCTRAQHSLIVYNQDQLVLSRKIQNG